MVMLICMHPYSKPISFPPSSSTEYVISAETFLIAQTSIQQTNIFGRVLMTSSLF